MSSQRTLQDFGVFKPMWPLYDTSALILDSGFTYIYPPQILTTHHPHTLFQSICFFSHG